GDGDLDLLVTSLGGGARLFLNDGHGHFHETTDEAGLRSKSGSMSMALADIDGDGDLDLYVANYRPDTIADLPTITYTMQMVDGKPVVAKVDGQPVTAPQWTNRFEVTPGGTVTELGEVDVLYLNDGHGRFTPVSFTDGTFLDEDGKPLREPPRDWGLAVHLRDFTGDGAPDIYVCNDFATPDRIWINDGHGRFRAMARTAVRVTPAFSMGVDFADVDRDGFIDFFAVDMLSPDHRKRHVQLGEANLFRWPPGVIDNRPQFSRNTLQRNRGDGTFAEIAYYAGVEASDWSWGPIFLDVDLDGYEDILVANGQLRDFQNIDKANAMQALLAGRRPTRNEIMQSIGQFPTLETPNVAYRNKGNWEFEDVGAAWGFATPGISQGMALADLDNDGDMDVVINNLRDAPGIYRNEGHAPRVAVRLKGKAGNTAGVGAKITVTGGPVSQSQEMIAGGRYLSGDQAQRVFAAGKSTALSIEVTWRNGQRGVATAAPNELCEIDEARAMPVTAPVSEKAITLFEEVKILPSPRHFEEPFDDFARQPLLTRSLSQLGPGVCWHDFNQDGWDDLVVGGGHGGRLSVWLNNQGANFTRLTNASFGRPVTRDQTAVLGMMQQLLAGSANYEDGLTNGGLLRIYDLQRNAAGDSLLGPAFSTGPLALGDVDGDGHLDLFVGGRVIAGRYPEPADSVLYRGEGGKLVVAQRFEKLGLVSGAIFSDLDQDGLPELILATEWGPVRVFKRVNGIFEEKTREWGLAEYTGWWNGVATVDLDGDGHLEIVASNWGLNTPYRASREHPRKLYYGDLDGNGTVDLVEARWDPAIGMEVPERTFNFTGPALPYLQERVPNFEAYAGKGTREIFGDHLDRSSVLEANTLSSMVFTFRNGKFEGNP
ncbi:MAG TPA: VCBS repeat-containing protein, partial [Verrucomicrobiae bacterium]|nr:VCBS repeat-containing protein [Verrucomicrobiae bacterium]